MRDERNESPKEDSFRSSRLMRAFLQSVAQAKGSKPGSRSLVVSAGLGAPLGSHGIRMTVKIDGNLESVSRRALLNRLASLSPVLPPQDVAEAITQSQASGVPKAAQALRPAWVGRGLVWTWGALPLIYYIRTGQATEDIFEEQKADFSEAAAQHYQQIGVNTVVMPLHLGSGLKAESEAIEGTKQFTAIAHRYGLKVVGYIGSTMWYETFYAEEPDAAKWEQIDERGRPMYYSTQTFRHAACRNNPGYRAFLKKVVRLGADELKLDGFHFDQLQWWPEPWSCHCRYCEEGFRAYLRSKYSNEQLRARLGHTNVAGIRVPDFNLEHPPVTWAGSVDDPLLQEWTQYRCGSLAQWWAEMREYIRELNPEASLQGNPTVPPGMNHGFVYGNDLGQLLPHCELMWTEDRNEPRWMADGRLVSRIREYKMARTMGRSLLFWQRVEGPQGDYKPPFPELPLTLGLAEALAYNDANLGVWNSKYKIEPVPGSRPAQYIHFFRSHVADLVETRIIADVAVLRSFASMEFHPAEANVSTVLLEQTLIQHKIPFTIIFDGQLKDASRYRALVLANQVALSEEQVQQIGRYAEAGGGVVVTEETAKLTEWGWERRKPGLAELLGIKYGETAQRRQFGKGRVVYVPRVEPAVKPAAATMTYNFENEHWKLPKNDEELVEAVRWAVGEELSAEVEAPLWVTMELAEQPSSGTRLLHLVNFKVDEVLKDIGVKVKVPKGLRLREVTWESPDGGARQVLQPSGREGLVSFRVPSLEIYSLVLMRMENMRPTLETSA